MHLRRLLSRIERMHAQPRSKLMQSRRTLLRTGVMALHARRIRMGSRRMRGDVRMMLEGMRFPSRSFSSRVQGVARGSRGESRRKPVYARFPRVSLRVMPLLLFASQRGEWHEQIRLRRSALDERPLRMHSPRWRLRSREKRTRRGMHTRNRRECDTPHIWQQVSNCATAGRAKRDGDDRCCANRVAPADCSRSPRACATSTGRLHREGTITRALARSSQALYVTKSSAVAFDAEPLHRRTARRGLTL
jgi:hypothetical protein